MKPKNRITVEGRLLKSMREAVGIAKGTAAPARVYSLPVTVRDAVVSSAPAFIADEIIAIRRNMNLSQSVFAQVLNVSLGAVRSWEQGDRFPQGSALRLLQIAHNTPEVLLMTIGSRRARRRGMAVAER